MISTDVVAHSNYREPLKELKSHLWMKAWFTSWFALPHYKWKKVGLRTVYIIIYHEHLSPLKKKERINQSESDSNTDVAIYVNLLLCIHYMNEVQMHLGIPLFFDVTQSKSNTIINVLYHLSVTQHMSSQNWLHFQTALRLFGPFAETIKQLICNGK